MMEKTGVSVQVSGSGIGPRIKFLRKYLELTQLVFAEKLGIDRSHISNIEKAGKMPSEMLIRHIANTYNANLDWLKDGTGKMLLSENACTIAPEYKLRLLTRAAQRHPKEGISFSGNATCWDDCFTIDLGLLMLWYNVGKDTRSIAEKITA